MKLIIFPPLSNTVVLICKVFELMHKNGADVGAFGIVLKTDANLGLLKQLHESIATGKFHLENKPTPMLQNVLFLLYK